jgi:HEAT repeat protein
MEKNPRIQQSARARTLARFLAFCAVAVTAMDCPVARAQSSPPQPGSGKQESAGALESGQAVTEAWKLLVDSASEKNRKKRVLALLALGNADPRPEVLGLLESAMNDSHEEVRRAAAAAFGQLPAPSAIPRLREALDDSAASVRVAAARALWVMNDHSGSGLFQRILLRQAKPEESGLRAEWNDTLARAKDPSALFLMGLQQGSSMLLGPYAIAVPVILRLSGDKSAPARASVATLLSDDHSDSAVRALEQGLKDKAAVIRVASAYALGKSARPEEIAELAPLLTDRKQPVRLAAAVAIVRLSPPTAPGVH